MGCANDEPVWERQVCRKKRTISTLVVRKRDCTWNWSARWRERGRFELNNTRASVEKVAFDDGIFEDSGEGLKRMWSHLEQGKNCNKSLLVSTGVFYCESQWSYLYHVSYSCRMVCS